MGNPAERLHHPIVTRELERRWAAVRKAMEERGIDALLMQSNNDFMGGYVKWFTDLPGTHGYPYTVIFPRADDMTVIVQTRFGTDDAVPKNDWLRRGVKRVLGAPYFSSAYYSVEYDAELAARALAPWAKGTIGLVGRGTLPVSIIDRVKADLPGAKLVDASDLVDRIKVPKSEDEWAHIRRTAEVQDGAIAAVMAAVKPGMRDIELAAIAEHYVLDHGGEQGLFLTVSHPEGEPVYWGNRHVQNRTLKKGDMFTLLVESNGPGGMYTEISRACYLGGKAPAALRDNFEMLLAARKFTLERLKPGASCKDIWDSYNAFLKKNGKPEEERLYCHGQGYDLVERPLVRKDEPLDIAASMNITCHPTWVADGWYHTICDNFMVGPQGVVGRLHKTPEKLYEIE